MMSLPPTFTGSTTYDPSSPTITTTTTSSTSPTHETEEGHIITVTKTKIVTTVCVVPQDPTQNQNPEPNRAVNGEEENGDGNESGNGESGSIYTGPALLYMHVDTDTESDSDAEVEDAGVTLRPFTRELMAGESESDTEVVRPDGAEDRGNTANGETVRGPVTNPTWAFR